MDSLTKNSDGFKPSDIERSCVKLSGLFHDLGHGPFSHIFDHMFGDSKIYNHENRSRDIVEYIFKEVGTTKCHKSAYIIDMVKEMIEPSDEYNTIPLYNIVNNGISKIDLDKFDYLARDSAHIGLTNNFDYNRIFIKSKISRGEIIYDYSILNNILELFTTRYRFHQEIYNHTTVKVIEIMLKDALIAADSVYNFRDWCNSEKFITLDDGIYASILNSDNKDLKKSKDILERIERRDLYNVIWSGSEEACDLDKYEDMNIIEMKFNLCNGSKHPLEKVKFIKQDIIKYGIEYDINLLYPDKYENKSIIIYENNK